MEFDLAFDANEATEVAGTKRTLELAGKALLQKGAFFSRPYGGWGDMTGSQCAQNAIALRRVKKIFDPNNVLNPGKLCF